MSKRINKVSRTKREHFRGRHRFEHWCVDDQVYFITARVRDRLPALASEAAKAVFWDRFDHYTKTFGFTPWVTSLLDNHYHTLGYMHEGAKLSVMMQRIHGSVAKLVNDILELGPLPTEAGRAGASTSGEYSSIGASRFSGMRGIRLVPFWRNSKGKEYFDGCIRNEKQCTLAYRYTLTQSSRHGVCPDWRTYPHTRVNVELERGVSRALELGAFLDGVPYQRYER